MAAAKWEHRVVVKHGPAIEQVLDEMVNDGWELIWMSSGFVELAPDTSSQPPRREVTTVHVATFRRARPETP